MGKKRRPPAKREKAPNQKEQRRYRRALRKKQQQNRKPCKRPLKFPLGYGTALMTAVLWGIGIAAAARMHAAFDSEAAILVMFPFLFLPFIAAPLLVKLLGKKWNDSDRAYNLIDRIDIVLWIIAIAVIFLVKIIFCIAKLFR